MLFKTIEEIQAILPIGAGNEFDRLQPHIKNAENRFIAPLLGTSLYEELCEFHETELPGEPTEVQQAMIELLQKVQHSLIHLAMYVGFDFLNVNVSDMGFQRMESEHTRGLFRYQEDNLKAYFANSGFDGLDLVLVFIEDNIQHFNEFKSSPNWTQFKSMFIPTVKVMEEIPYNIHGSRLIFLSLKPLMALAEDTKILPLLGVSVFEEIKSEMVKDEPAEKVTAILPYIRKPLAWLSTAMLMEETGATLDERGLFFEKTDGTDPGARLKQPSLPEDVRRLILRNYSVAEGYLSALAKYVSTHMEDWPEYSNPSSFRYSRDNTDKKTFWA